MHIGKCENCGDFAPLGEDNLCKLCQVEEKEEERRHRKSYNTYLSLKSQEQFERNLGKRF
jgi:hypothetical protein